MSGQAGNAAQSVYERRLRVRSEDTNCYRRMRTASLFRLFEEASIAHTEALDMGRDKTLDRGLLWVILRQSVEIREMPAYDDEILVRSWPGEQMNFLFPRFYEVVRGGEVIVTGEALWMLISEETRTAVIPEQYGIRIPGVRQMPELLLAGAVRKPAGAAEVLQEDMQARFSLVDINGHINNVRYFDLAEDMMTAEETARVPHRITCEYPKEIRLGTAFTVRKDAQPGEVLYFEGQNRADSAVMIRLLLAYEAKL